MSPKKLFISLIGLILLTISVPTQLISSHESDAPFPENRAQAGDEEEDKKKHPLEYFVQLAPETDEAEIETLLEELNSKEIWHSEAMGLRLWAVKKFPYTQSHNTISHIDAQVGWAKKKTRIKSSMPNPGFLLSPEEVSTSAACFQQWSPPIPGGSEPITISIFDTGISQKITKSSTQEFNFGPAHYTGYDYINQDHKPDDNNGHGSHIAGLIYHLIAQGAPNAPIHFDIRKTHDKKGRGFLSNIVRAVDDAVKEGVDVINMSFSYQGIPEPDSFNPLEIAIDYAEQEGVLVVAAAGNNQADNDLAQWVSFPASFSSPNILSVAAHDCTGALSTYSNYGMNAVDVIALGDNIPGPTLKKGVTYASGTSYSTAIVTAYAALLGTHQEEFEYSSIKCALIQASQEIPETFLPTVSQGVLDFPAALAQLGDCGAELEEVMAVSSPPPPPAFPFSSQDITLYPNPTHEGVTVSLEVEQAQSISVQIYQGTGQAIFSKEFQLSEGKQLVSIPEIKHLTPGIYFLQLRTSDAMSGFHLIKK